MNVTPLFIRFQCTVVTRDCCNTFANPYVYNSSVYYKIHFAYALLIVVGTIWIHVAQLFSETNDLTHIITEEYLKMNIQQVYFVYLNYD